MRCWRKVNGVGGCVCFTTSFTEKDLKYCPAQRFVEMRRTSPSRGLHGAGTSLNILNKLVRVVSAFSFVFQYFLYRNPRSLSLVHTLHSLNSHVFLMSLSASVSVSVSVSFVRMGTLNDVHTLNMNSPAQREFLVTPNTAVVLQNTGTIPLLVYCVFPFDLDAPLSTSEIGRLVQGHAGHTAGNCGC